MIYSDVIAEHTGEETTWTDATTNPNYSPEYNGRLIQLKLAFAQTAVTSVIQNCMAQCKSASWGSKPVTVLLSGGGLLTEPSPIVPIGVQNCDVPVNTNNVIKTQFRHQAGGITPVTVNMLLLGTFEAA